MPSHSDSSSALPATSPLQLLRNGRRAVREVPGLRAFLLKGFLLNYLVFLVIAALALSSLYLFLVAPAQESLAAWQAEGGFWRSILTVVLHGLLVITQVVLSGAVMLFSLLLSLALMSVWFEALAAKVVAHQRGKAPEEAAFTLRAWVGSLGRALKDSAVLLLLSLASLLLALLPVVGALLALLINAFLMGWDVREPYLAVRSGLGDDPKALKRGRLFWTASVGLVPLLSALVPVLGWLLLPWLMIVLVAGVAWSGEAALKRG